MILSSLMYYFVIDNVGIPSGTNSNSNNEYQQNDVFIYANTIDHIKHKIPLQKQYYMNYHYCMSGFVFMNLNVYFTSFGRSLNVYFTSFGGQVAFISTFKYR